MTRYMTLDDPQSGEVHVVTVLMRGDLFIAGTIEGEPTTLCIIDSFTNSEEARARAVSLNAYSRASA